MRCVIRTFLCWLAVAMTSARAADQLYLSRDSVPYTLAKVNYLSGNYLQSLLDRRSDLLLFAHDYAPDERGLGQSEFVDDTGRAVWAFAEEERYTPVVRLDLVRTLCRGLMRARIPGTRDRHFFTREGRQGLNVFFPPSAGVIFRWLQDSQIPYAELRFRGRTSDGQWVTGEDCTRHDETVRESPAETTVRRTYRQAGADLFTLTGRCWSSVLDRSPVITIESGRLTDLVISVDLPSADPKDWKGTTSTWLMAPDGRALRAQAGQQLVWDRPVFDYAIFLTQTLGEDDGNWQSRRYWDTHATARLFVWRRTPARVTWITDETGRRFNRVEFAFKAHDGSLQAELLVTGFGAVDPNDTGYLHALGQHVARDGQYGMSGYYPARTANDFAGVMVGLAAGGYLLRKYAEPSAPEVLAAAKGAFSSFVDAEQGGVQAEYLNNLVAAALYLKRAGVTGFDYEHWARIWARREMKRRPAGSPVILWPETTMRMMLALEAAQELTGDKEFAKAYAAARSTFSLGQRPATFRFGDQQVPYTNCSAGAFLFAAMGHENADSATAFIRHGPDYFCDFGWAVDRSWSCDDLAAWYVGYSAKGLGIGGSPGARKQVLSLRDFPEYDEQGRVTITHELSVPNPYYPLPLRARQEVPSKKPRR